MTNCFYMLCWGEVLTFFYNTWLLRKSDLNFQASELEFAAVILSGTSGHYLLTQVISVVFLFWNDWLFGLRSNYYFFLIKIKKVLWNCCVSYYVSHPNLYPVIIMYAFTCFLFSGKPSLKWHKVSIREWISGLLL